MALTRDIARFVCELDAARIPAAAFATVRRGMADCVGVAFAGSVEPVSAHALALLDDAPRQGTSRIWAGDACVGAADAARTNAVMAHALDFDDTGLEGHPSVVLAPVVLAEAERLGSSWRDAVVAYVAGYETWAELLGRDQDRHHAKGWHPTAVFGTVAAAAASSRMRGLPQAATRNALGIAASMAGGLVANFGSMTKALQVGLAASNGMLASTLAERGLSAAADALESPTGLLHAISPAGRVRLDGDCRIGQDWQILRQGLNVKRYPACYATHRIIDAALQLHAPLAGRIADIDEIVIELGEVQAAMLRREPPDNGLDARFSAPYVVACALLRGDVRLQDFREQAVLATQVRQLLPRSRVVLLSQRDALEPLFSPADRVRVRMRDGSTVESAAVQRARGHASRPLEHAELAAKFLDCAGIVLDEAGARAWWAHVCAPDDAPVRWPARTRRASAGTL